MSASRPSSVHATDGKGVPPAPREGSPGSRDAHSPERPPVTVEGSLERVTYTNEEAGWSVVRVVVPGLEAPHDAPGYVPGKRGREKLKERAR